MGWPQTGFDPIPLPNPPSLAPTPHGRGSRSPGSGNATPALVTGGGEWMGTGKGAPQRGWDGKRSRKGGIWEESSTAWVVSGEGKAPDPLYKYSQANTRREQNISTGRKNSGENKGCRLEQVIPGYQPQPLYMGTLQAASPKRSLEISPSESALTPLGMCIVSCSSLEFQGVCRTCRTWRKRWEK